MMKQLKTIMLGALAMVTAISCNKEINNIDQTIPQESIVTLSLSTNSTKASGVEQGNQIYDNNINTLEFFIFNADGEAKGVLDSYEKFSEEDGITNLQVKATTGAKNIYVVANSHKSDWKGVVTLAEFQAQITSLTQEDNKDFVMVGNIDATLQASTSLTVAISRLVAKVKLASIKTTFAGTPYEGMALSNVKAYLTNVHSSKLFHNGEISTPIILNDKKYVAEDINSCTMSGMLYDAIPTSIADAGYTTAHYFYAYENMMEVESTTNRFTRLVIQADLDGNTYYYPVNINQEGYGYVASNGHKGVKRNTAYEINVNILRPGSTNPDENVEYGVMSCSINVLDWSSTTTANPEF